MEDLQKFSQIHLHTSEPHHDSLRAIPSNIKISSTYMRRLAVRTTFINPLWPDPRGRGSLDFHLRWVLLYLSTTILDHTLHGNIVKLLFEKRGDSLTLKVFLRICAMVLQAIRH